MKTSFDNNNGWSINGLTMDEMFLIKSLIEEMQMSCNELENVDEENEVNFVLAEHEVEIVKNIEIED